MQVSTFGSNTRFGASVTIDAPSKEILTPVCNIFPFTAIFNWSFDQFKRRAARELPQDIGIEFVHGSGRESTEWVNTRVQLKDGSQHILPFDTAFTFNRAFDSVKRFLADRNPS